MVNEHWTERLSEYLDGEMEAAAKSACAAHLEECASCSSTLEDLRFLKDQAALLPDIPPARDLWPEIEDRLGDGPMVVEHGPASSPSDGPGVVPLRRRRVVLTIPQLIAAAIALLLFAGGAFRLMLPAPAPEPAPGSLAAAPSTTGAPGATQVMFAAAYDEAIDELEAEFERRRSQLDPETVRVVEENLAIIDAAIAEARGALQEDPSSAFLNTHVAGAMRQKVDLLRRVASIEQTEI